MKRIMCKQRQLMLEAKDFVDDMNKTIPMTEEEESIVYEFITRY